jgi:hypothetical protein
MQFGLVRRMTRFPRTSTTRFLTSTARGLHRVTLAVVLALDIVFGRDRPRAREPNYLDAALFACPTAATWKDHAALLQPFYPFVGSTERAKVWRARLR